MKSTLVLLINFLILGQKLLASTELEMPIPEKMQARITKNIKQMSHHYSHEQGGIIIASNNNSFVDTNLNPTITFVREVAPYKVFKISLLDGNPVGIHFMVLPVGNYIIDGFYDGDDPLNIRNQNLFRAKFKVKPNSIEYLGRAKITVSPDGNFTFQVKDFYSEDVSSFRKLKGNVPVVRCILNFGGGGSCLKIKEESHEVS